MASNKKRRFKQKEGVLTSFRHTLWNCLSYLNVPVCSAYHQVLQKNNSKKFVREKAFSPQNFFKEPEKVDRISYCKKSNIICSYFSEAVILPCTSFLISLTYICATKKIFYLQEIFFSALKYFHGSRSIFSALCMILQHYTFTVLKCWSRFDGSKGQCMLVTSKLGLK